MKRSIIGTAFALVLAFASPSRAASEVSDASCQVAYDQGAGYQRTAQTFTAQHTGSLTRASAEVSANPAGANFTLRIRAVTDMGAPSATVLASAAISNVPATGPPTPRTLEAVFASPAQVVAGQRYAISIESPPGAMVDVRTDNPCTGTLFLDNSGTDNWAIYDASWDMIFAAFVTPPTAGQTPPGSIQGQGVALATASGLEFSNTAFAAQGSGPSATSARRKRPARGTKVGFRLDKAANVRFTITRRAKGRKVKRGKNTVCVKPPTMNRKLTHCTRVVTLSGSFSRNGVAGHNSFHFTGRLHGQKLKPRRYRLVATPSTGGQKGKSTATGFRILP